MDEIIHWIVGTRLSWFVTHYGWVWPISETLHFCGLTVLAGSVGLFDLRLLGVFKGLSPAALHRLLRWSVAGFGLSVATGITFIAGMPDQYFYNDAFKLKVICLLLMGLNAAFFYAFEFRRVLALGADDDASGRARFIAGASLLLLAAVMLCGRMLTFFRPPF